jgi:hypothetical protein
VWHGLVRRNERPNNQKTQLVALADLLARRELRVVRDG